MTQNQKTKTKSNAKTALLELASMVGLAETPAEERPLSAVAAEPPAAEDPLSRLVQTPPPSVASEPVAAVRTIAPAPSAGTSTIAKGVIIEGNICSEGSFDCYGEIQGDVSVKERISTSGKHRGNLQGQSIYFSCATIAGNVTAREHIDIDQNTNIAGDIRAGSVLLDGQVTGLVCADGLVCLHKHAILNGDVVAGSLSIEEGAQISGQISMKSAPLKTP